MSVIEEAIKKASGETTTVQSRERFYLSSGYKKKNWSAWFGMAVFGLSLALAIGVFALEHQARIAAETDLETALLDVKKAQGDLEQSEREADEMAAQYEERLEEAKSREQSFADRFDTVVREKDAIEFRSGQKDSQIRALESQAADLRQDRSRLSKLLRLKSASVTS